VVLELQQGHGTRRQQPSGISRRMGHHRMQRLQNNTSRTVMERRNDTRLSERPNLGWSLLGLCGLVGESPVGSVLNPTYAFQVGIIPMMSILVPPGLSSGNAKEIS
jgi:hypothetical protein